MRNLILFEDEHLLVVNKPAGWNTHSPGPEAGEGLYEWLRHREPRWARLAILHRLDKETSGVMVFGKSALANRSLTEQFTQRRVRKRYVLATDQPMPQREFTVTSCLVRAGQRYLSRPPHAGGATATTRFRTTGRTAGRTLVEAEPVTGRTHQIRAQAAAQGIPILGDTLYGGTPARRVFLHAARLELDHPDTGRRASFEAGIDFESDPALALRAALINAEETDAFRLIHGASDRWPGWQVDRLGDFLLSQSAEALDAAQRSWLAAQAQARAGVYDKRLDRQVRRAAPAESSPQPLSGEPAAERFTVRENGLRFELSLGEGYSTGLFLDQRDNRRRLLTGHVAAEFELFPGTAPGRRLLNAFAYTCAFSVCAARAGLHTTSLDLSRKYLEWGRRNFALNGLDAGAHEFIYGDAFDWLKRLGKKGRIYEVVMLDPPTFSQSKEHGRFQAEKDYGRLVKAALPLLAPQGVLFASTNAARYGAGSFLEDLEEAIQSSGRQITQRHFAPQPPDFPISPAEPAYLKTVWLRVQ